MPKGDALYVGYMLDMARKALQLVEGKDRVAFDQDETLRLALVHLIQVIGEAARGISHEISKSQPPHSLEIDYWYAEQNRTRLYRL